MELPLKEVINFVNKNKHLKRSDVCRDDIPISTYHRWLKKSNIDFLNLDKILTRLHLTWSEFYYLLNYNNDFCYHKLYKKILTSYQHKKINSLTECQDYCRKHTQKYKNDYFLHLDNLITIFIAHLTNDKTVDYTELPLIQYLLNTDFYTQYEFSYINHIIVIVPFDLANTIYQKVSHKSYKYKFLYKYFIRLDINYIFAALHQNQLQYIQEPINKLQSLCIPENNLLDKITIKFLVQIGEYLNNPTYNNKKAINDYLKLVKQLDCPNLYNLLQKVAYSVINNIDK